MSVLTWLRVQWDRVGAVVAVLAGAGALVAAWVRASGTTELAHHVPYLISGGLGGIFLLGIGSTLWVSSDLRDEWGELHRLTGELSQLRREVPDYGPVADAREPMATTRVG